jgi:hypothetical protein
MTLAYACWIIAFFAWGRTAVAGSVLAGWLA